MSTELLLDDEEVNKVNTTSSEDRSDEMDSAIAESDLERLTALRKEDQGEEEKLFHILGAAPSRIADAATSSVAEKEGYLFKKLAATGTWRKYFFRFSPATLTLFYFTSKEDAYAANAKKKPRGTVYLGFVAKGKIVEEDRLVHKQIKYNSASEVCLWRLYCYTTRRIVELSAATDDEALEWFGLLDSSLRQFSAPEEMKGKEDALHALEPIVQRHRDLQIEQHDLLLKTLEKSGMLTYKSVPKLKEGYIDMKKDDGAWKRYYVIFFKNSVSYYNPEDRTKPRGVLSTESVLSVRPEHITKIDAAATDEAKKKAEDLRNREFVIFTPLRSYECRVKHPVAMLDWISMFQQHCPSLITKFEIRPKDLDGEPVPKGFVPTLTYTDGKKAMKVKVKATVVVGRSSRVDAPVLSDKKVSRNHCRIEISAKNIPVITDMGSAAGTKINDKKTTRAALKDGDTISVGETNIVFTYTKKGFFG